jgi:hypothetical protein
MPSPLRTPKTLSSWLQLDYFDRPRPLRWLWWPAVVAALLLAGAYAAWSIAARPANLQAGPLSDAHAMFNDDCRQCHVGAFHTAARLLTHDPAVRSVTDDACLKCHGGAVHHANAVEHRACASCHREHRGRHALVRVEDGHCTSCHANLKTADGTLNFAPHVAAFAEGRHPPFHDRKDSGTVHFNHAAHLGPSGVLEIDWAQLGLQGRQARKQKAGVVFLGAGEKEKRRRHLQCQDCHQPDAAGRFMLPIRFEQHCQSCHPLAVQLVGPWTPSNKEQVAAAGRFSRTPAPHPSPYALPGAMPGGPDAAEGRNPALLVRGVLRDRLTRFIQEPANAKAFLGFEPPPPPRPIPGTRRAAPLPEAGHDWVNGQLDEVERLLFDGAGGCRYCHTEKTAPDKRPTGLPKYHPAGIPERWFDLKGNTTFSHKSHRMLACTECHEKAPASRLTADVLMPPMDVCLKCHDARAARARSDCVECHTYHGPARRRQFRGEMKLDDLLGR